MNNPNGVTNTNGVPNPNGVTNTRGSRLFGLIGTVPEMVQGKYNTGEMQFGIGENQPAGRNLALALQNEAMIASREAGSASLYDYRNFEPQALNFIDDYNKSITGGGAATWSNTPQFRLALYRLT